MKFSKSEKKDFIRSEIRKAEQFLINNQEASKDVKFAYNERIDILLEILAELN